MAVKIVPREGKSGERARREAQAMSKLDHPRCLRAYACGRDAENVYIAYAYVPGATFRESLRAGRVTDAVAVEVAAQVLDGLAHAHDRGIVHRDVKPANVLLADDSESEDLGAHPRLRPRALRGGRDAHRRRRRPGDARVHRARAPARRARRCRRETSGRSACCCTRRSRAVTRSGGRRSARRPRRSRRGRRRCARSGPTCRTGCSRRSTVRSWSIPKKRPSAAKLARLLGRARGDDRGARPRRSRRSRGSCSPALATGIYAGGSRRAAAVLPGARRAPARNRRRRVDARRASLRARVRARGADLPPRQCRARAGAPLHGARRRRLARARA